MATKNKKDKRSPASRLRYEAANPTVSVRISQEFRDELDEIRETSGMSLGDILKAGLDQLSCQSSLSWHRS